MLVTKEVISSFSSRNNPLPFSLFPFPFLMGFLVLEEEPSFWRSQKTATREYIPQLAVYGIFGADLSGWFVILKAPDAVVEVGEKNAAKGAQKVEEGIGDICHGGNAQHA